MGVRIFHFVLNSIHVQLQEGILAMKKVRVAGCLIGCSFSEFRYCFEAHQGVIMCMRRRVMSLVKISANVRLDFF